MKKIFFLMIACMLILCGCSAEEHEAQLNDDGTLTVASAKELIKEGAVLVDVRSKSEYNSGHIDGAKLLPVESINVSNAKEVIASKDTVVIVYCRSGARSASAAKVLEELGYTNVYNLGAMSNWEK